MGNTLLNYVRDFMARMYDAGHTVVPFNNKQFEAGVEAVTLYVSSHPEEFLDEYSDIMQLLEVDPLTAKHERLLFNLRALFGKMLYVVQDDFNLVEIRVDDEYLQFLRDYSFTNLSDEVRNKLVELFWNACQR